MTTTRTTNIGTRALVAFAAAALLAACGDSKTSTTTDSIPPVIDLGDGADYKPTLDPANFVDVIDNPYLPLAVGAEWYYEGMSGEGLETITVVVTGDRKTILGISAFVVRDTVTLDGELIEDTYDWFAQDKEGTVWYLGEDVKDYENGVVVSTAGSWEAGVDGALAGIAMPAVPALGEAYRLEYYAGEAEDMFEIIGVDRTLTVPFGTFDRAITTKDWTPLSPDVIEEKWHAFGVGLLYETHISGGGGFVELVSYTPGS